MTTVSAIISLYNAERFLRGRLDDLLAQTLYAQKRLEIIAIISGSQQHEARILREYLRKGARIRVITTLREGIYSAWNRGIRLATGDYITNANADDRLHPQALAGLAWALDHNPAVGVVYADSHVTAQSNATMTRFQPSARAPYTSGALEWSAFSTRKLAQTCCIGHYPMWRKSIHEKIGYFDESYLLAGDYEFWLRCAANGIQFRHYARRMGLFYYADNATTVNQQQSDYEARRAQLKWSDALAA